MPRSISISTLLITSFLANLCISRLPTTSASNILFVHLLATSSHRTSIWPLAERLAEKGHNVTYIFPAAENRDGFNPKIEEIIPSKMLPILKNFLGDFDINFRLNNTITLWTWQAFTKSVDLCAAFYESPEIQEWLFRPDLHYDLVMLDATLGECGYGLVYRFQAKHILFQPVLTNYFWDGFGIVPETASIPENYFHAKSTEMGFFNRMAGTLASLLFRLAFLNFLDKIEPIIKTSLNSSEMPNLLEFERNTSLVFLNTHFIEDYPVALPPMMISYSGLWCGKNKRDNGRKPLPKDILAFLNQVSSNNETQQGFIYVSFGSAVVVSGLPKNIVDKFFKAFAQFPKVKFLWKWTGDVPVNKPKNVMFKRWFPQRDLLAHFKIKGFITQAGRPSIQEALCYGVPMISFPIFADQDNNANRLENLGVSKTLDITKFTEDSLQKAIHEMIHNNLCKTRMKKLSAMFRDRLVDPVDNVLYWTEFVLQHDTSILKPLGMNHTWWQRRLLDVYMVLLLVIVFIAAVGSSIVYFTFKLIISRVTMYTKIKLD